MENEENQNQVSLRFPPPLEIAPRFPQSHNPDDDSPLPKTQNQKARKEPQRLKKPQPPSSGSSFDEKMLPKSCPMQDDPERGECFQHKMILKRRQPGEGTLRVNANHHAACTTSHAGRDARVCGFQRSPQLYRRRAQADLRPRRAHPADERYRMRPPHAATQAETAGQLPLPLVNPSTRGRGLAAPDSAWMAGGGESSTNVPGPGHTQFRFPLPPRTPSERRSTRSAGPSPDQPLFRIILGLENAKKGRSVNDDLM